MSQSGEPGQKSWISPTTITWFISFLFAAFGFWYGTNREDSKAITEAVSSLRERVAAVEARLNGLERREPR